VIVLFVVWGMTVLAQEVAGAQALPQTAMERMLEGAKTRGLEGDWAGAEQEYRTLLRMDPTSVASAQGLAEALMAQDKPDQALTIYDSELLAFEWESVQTLAGLLESTQPQRAAVLYARLRTLNPNGNPDAWWLG